MGVEEVRRAKVITQPADNFTFMQIARKPITTLEEAAKLCRTSHFTERVFVNLCFVLVGFGVPKSEDPCFKLLGRLNIQTQ